MKERYFFKNSRLFSDYYLKELLPNDPIWEIDVSEYFKKIKEIYERKKDVIESLNEPSLEDQFIRPILRVLGHKWEVQPSLRKYKKPDYSFYETEEEKVKAELSKDYFGNAIAVGEVKRWERSLDRKLKSESDPFEVYAPSLQMERYLWLAEVKWGILTNGRFWRIYERNTSNKLDIYYEIDLVNILENNDLEAFKYFYLFFRKKAFPDFLNKVYEESIDYAKAVGEDLKSNVYKAIRILANGFLETPGNNLSIDNLQEIHDNSLIFLYRLLFVLYAESRGLLPLQKLIYRKSYSLYSIKNEISKKIDSNESIPILQKSYWSRINVLFNLINNGSKSFGISKDEFIVPPYNGGLFNPDKNTFLEKNEISDTFIAKVIDLLSRSTIKNEAGKAFVDYSSLDIRHLGSIYEGLLENKLKIAQEDMSAIKKGNKETWIKSEQLGNRKEIDKVLKGKLYPVTDRGERKATGSYYTPDYIVKYIVENTVTPLIEEKKSKIKREEDLIDEILSLKILDPAMGSGHFLVEATDFIARSLVEALGVSPKEIEEEDIRWARREVVERCIYGVDLNPLAVELAKLSLWLSTVSKDKPLSFLDYHLKCGNSLIGAKIRDLGKLPSVKRKKITTQEKFIQLSLYEQSLKKRLPIVLSDVIKILKEPSDKVEQIREKENIYNKILGVLIPFKDAANIWISSYFDNKNIEYEWMLGLLETQGEWKEVIKKEWFKKAFILNNKNHFFHWELEFPEIFFDEYGREKDNTGFDVVTGNPPWVESKFMRDGDKNYYKVNFESMRKQFDIFNGFVEKGISLLKNKGILGFIIPSRFVMNLDYEPFRKYLLNYVSILEIVDVGEYIFEGVEMPALIIVIQKEKEENKRKRSKISVKLEIEDLKSNKLKEYKIPQVRFHNEKHHLFTIYQSDLLNTIIKKIEVHSKPFRDFVKNARGVEIGKGSKIISEKKISEDCVPFLVGEDIGRYTIYGHRYLKLGVSDINYKKPSLYKGEKILIRKTGVGINATYDNSEFYVIQVIYIFKNRKDKPSLKYMLGILNSHLMAEYYFSKFGERDKKAFPHLRQGAILDLPIRTIDFNNAIDKKLHKNLVTLVDIILDLNKKVQTVKGSEKDRLQDHIERVDKEIDDLVYELYGITEEEMKIIKNEPN